MKLKTFMMLLTAGMFISQSAAAIKTEEVLKARQGLMRIYAFNLALVGDMAKGKTPYNPETAQIAADNLLAAASMKNGAMWPQGSGVDNPEFGDKTRALPEIWSTYPEIGERGAALIDALENFVEVAGQGPDPMRTSMKQVGKACKGCHQDFRAEKK